MGRRVADLASPPPSLPPPLPRLIPPPLTPAKRVPPNQIHLSLSLPASLTATSGPNLDPYASKALLVMEKKLVAWLGEVAGETGGSAPSA